MNSALPSHQRNTNGSRGWILRLTLGGVLIGLSVWGIALCNEVFRFSLGPGSSPTDVNFANLGARTAWILFFGPVATAGVVMVWSTLRKMGVLDEFASWLSERAGRPDESVVNSTEQRALVSGGETDDPRGLESLSAEAVERLQRTAGRTAVILGGLTGVSLLAIGIFGLLSLLFFSQPDSGSPVYGGLLTVRLTIYFAVSSGVSVVLGLTILQRTFRKENTGWLLPLRIFTHMILRRRAGGRPERKESHRPDTKSLPRA